MTNLDQEAVAAPALAPEILGYYQQGREDGRLRAGAGLLELLRTQDVLRRLLPAAPVRVLDVGGGSGVHAEWLAAAGHQVELVDPVPLHVEQAGELAGVRAQLGDARALAAADDSFDVVLLLGPLYHLTDAAERAQALAEARRVLRPGGLLVAATINRFAGLHDTLNQGRWFDPERRPYIEAATRDGRLRSENPQSGFTTAYFHQPAEIVGEFTTAGLTPLGQYGVEGAGWLMGAVADWLDDPAHRESLLDALRLTESDPALLGVSGHLLTAGRKPEAVAMTLLSPEPIHTERLTLLPLRVEHAEEMAAVLSDPALHTYIGGEPATPAALRTRYERLVAGSPDPAVAWCNWVVQLPDQACLVGTVQATVTLDEREELHAEVAWVVGTPWQGQGFACEAAQGLVNWLGEQAVRTVIAHIHPDHQASAHVAASAGLTPTDQWHDGEIRWQLARG